jgi:predicted metal-dependent phosphoesterase TrpH
VLKVKACLHLHIQGDPIDNINYQFKDVVKKAVAENFKVLAVTAHDKIMYSKEMHELAAQNGILLIPGIEKTIEGKHVVILNCHQSAEQIESFKQLQEYKQTHDESFILAVHPFFYVSNCLKEKLEQYINLFDGIEFNYFYNNYLNPNKRALKIAKKYNKPVIGTSDVHLIEYFSNTYTSINVHNLTIPEVIDALKKNQLDITTKSFSILELIKILSKLVIAQFSKRK